MNQKTVTTPQQTVLIFQGGGALGAFQAGVFEALDAAGLAPDWVIGTSIGAINGALIAGNPPERRLERLYEFWGRLGQDLRHAEADAGGLPWQTLATLALGRPHFFAPRWGHGFAFGLPVAAGEAGFYDTAPLKRTLEELVDFDYLNASPVRLAVGAVDVADGTLRYFDSRRERLGVAHILASSALPPAFPAVAIDGRHYWDGGIHSNTPLEWMLRDAPRRHSLCFLATLWPRRDGVPARLADVLRRDKELRYASRLEALIGLEQELHRLRHGISLLAGKLPKSARAEADVARTIRLGCRSVYHLVRLQAPRLAAEDQSKDIEFAPARVGQRWAAGRRDALRALAARPWEQPLDPEDGVVLHDFAGDAGNREEQVHHA